MKGDVASAIDVVYLGPLRLDRVPRSEEVGRITVAPNGEHRRMLEQKEVVVGGTPLHFPLVEGPLQVPGLGVWKAS